MCSPELADVTDPKNMTDDEINDEEAKFKSIVFLKRSDQARYGGLLTELANGAHLKRDEYPKSETEALDIMVRRSGAFTTSLSDQGGRGDRHRYHRGGRGGGRVGRFLERDNHFQPKSWPLPPPILPCAWLLLALEGGEG